MEFNIRCDHDIYNARINLDNMDSGWKLRRDLLKPDNYIWDENWTVKANKEYTAQYNETILKNAEELDKARENAGKEFQVAVIRYITDEYGVTESIAKVVWNWCIANFEDEAHHWIGDAIELLEEVKNA